MDKNVIWLQRADEPANAFHAFTIYRDLGSARSLNAVATQLGVSKRQVTRYNTKYDWQARVRAFDLYQQRRGLELLEEELRLDARAEAEKWRRRRQEFREEAFEYGQKLMERAKEMMRFPFQEVTRQEEDGKTFVTIKPVRWNQNSVVHTIRMAMELKILSTGLSPGTHPLDDVDLDNLSTEDLDAILKDVPITISKERN